MYRMISPKFRIDLNLVGGFSQTFSCTYVFCISLSTPPPLQKKEAVHVRTFVYYYSCVLSVV